MNRIAPLLLLLLALLAGCLGSGDAPDKEDPDVAGEPDPQLPTRPGSTTPPGNGTIRPSPSTLLWSGQVLEAIGCKQTLHLAVAERSAVESRIPDHLTVPGNGPIALTMILLDCDSMTVGNSSLQKGAGIYLTYLAVDDQDPSTEEALTYLLEFGSDWDQAWQGLHARGVPAVGGSFQNEVIAGTDATAFTAGALAYSFRDTGQNPSHDLSGTARTLLLAGPNAEVAIRFDLHSTELADIPVPGTMQLQGGVLEELFGPVAPSVASEGSGSATFQASSDWIGS